MATDIMNLRPDTRGAAVRIPVPKIPRDKIPDATLFPGTKFATPPNTRIKIHVKISNT
jgi:hypothetical protein